MLARGETSRYYCIWCEEEADVLVRYEYETGAWVPATEWSDMCSSCERRMIPSTDD